MEPGACNVARVFTRSRSWEAARFMYCSTRAPCELGSWAVTRSLLAVMSLRHSVFTRLTRSERLNTGPLGPPPPPPQAASPPTTSSAAALRRRGRRARPRQMRARYPRLVLSDYASYENGIGLDWYALHPNPRALLDRLLPYPDYRLRRAARRRVRRAVRRSTGPARR